MHQTRTTPGRADRAPRQSLAREISAVLHERARRSGARTRSPRHVHHDRRTTMTTPDPGCPRAYEAEMRQIATLNGQQTSALAHVCTGTTPATHVRVHTTGRVLGGVAELAVETRTLLAEASTTRAHLQRQLDDGVVFTLTGGQASRFAEFFSGDIDRMHVFAPLAVDAPPPGLLLEADIAGRPTCTWLLHGDGELTMPTCTPGRAITKTVDDPVYQVEAALCELYRFAPTAAMAFQPRLDEAREQCAGLEFDDEGRRETYGVLTVEILHALDERHPFRDLTCQAPVGGSGAARGYGWSVRAHARRALSLVEPIAARAGGR